MLLRGLTMFSEGPAMLSEDPTMLAEGSPTMHAEGFTTNIGPIMLLRGPYHALIAHRLLPSSQGPTTLIRPYHSTMLSEGHQALKLSLQ